MTKMNNNRIDKTISISKLFYCYQSLLTDKQKEYYELYFEEDLSFQEIADQKQISKAAVYDAVNKITNILNDFENKLHFNQKQEAIESIINYYKDVQNKDVQNIIKELEEVK